jgi:hypothetical protein
MSSSSWLVFYVNIIIITLIVWRPLNRHFPPAQTDNQSRHAFLFSVAVVRRRGHHTEMNKETR